MSKLTSRFLFIVSFSFLLLFSYWVGGGVLYPLGVGVFLALFYLVLVGLVFFFHVIPGVGRRVLEAAVLVVLFASFHMYPPLSLTAILAALFVLLYPVYLGWRYGVFKDLTHVVLWFVLSAALGVGPLMASASNPLDQRPRRRVDGATSPLHPPKNIPPPQKTTPKASGHVTEVRCGGSMCQEDGGPGGIRRPALAVNPRPTA